MFSSLFIGFLLVLFYCCFISYPSPFILPPLISVLIFLVILLLSFICFLSPSSFHSFSTLTLPIFLLISTGYSLLIKSLFLYGCVPNWKNCFIHNVKSITKGAKKISCSLYHSRKYPINCAMLYLYKSQTKNKFYLPYSAQFSLFSIDNFKIGYVIVWGWLYNFFHTDAIWQDYRFSIAISMANVQKNPTLYFHQFSPSFLGLTALHPRSWINIIYSVPNVSIEFSNFFFTFVEKGHRWVFPRIL